MNTIVFFLMVYSHNNFIIPTMEFNSLEKCEKAILTYKTTSGFDSKWIDKQYLFCTKFENN